MKRLVSVWSLICIAAFVSAQKFSVNHDGASIYFTVTDADKRQVEVTFVGNASAIDTTAYRGELQIPAVVTYQDCRYQVKGIGKKAFSNSTQLRGITLPLGLGFIDDFAFEGCTRLEKVIFPGNPVRFGNGVFFRCPAISRVSLGSDWQSVNLKMFRWSSKLTSLFIPAKITRILNLKSLKGLEAVTVDENNERFASVDGVLYNKNKTTLLGCPRAYQGALVVPAGTESIRWAALADCVDITSVDLPASIHSFSYREFARMKRLQHILMRGEQPVSTAVNEENSCFAIKLGSKQAKLIVLKSAHKNYVDALCAATGVYREIADNTPEGFTQDFASIPIEVSAHELLQPKRVVAVSNFSKYE